MVNRAIRDSFQLSGILRNRYNCFSSALDLSRNRVRQRRRAKRKWRRRGTRKWRRRGSRKWRREGYKEVEKEG
jgi:hypothetical protein